MIQISDKKKCCGCTACYNVCPKKAIEMKPDREGFLYPEVDCKNCVDCGLCEKVCPVLTQEKHEEETKGYIVRHKNADVVKDSTSGGAFTAFAEYFLKNDAVVYGAGYDDEMQVVCKKATDMNQLAEMRGSKFVQSYLGETYAEIKEKLRSGKQIVYSGTPCQVAGLISFLGGKPENLFCIDFVCRGVPSPGLWKNYVDMMQKKYQSKMIGAKFKNKTYGYHATTMKIDFANGKSWYGSGRVDPMMKAFVKEMASRPSCSACAFKSTEHVSDITMFDCYEYAAITGNADDNKGYTSLFVHTKKGEQLLNQVSDQLTIHPVDVEKLVTKNGIMVRNSAKANPKREKFYELAAQYPIDVAMNMTAPITKKDYLIEWSKGILFRCGLIQILKKLKRKKKKLQK